MEHLTTTPFGRRPVTAGLLASQALAQADPQVENYDKWELFRALCAARTVIGVSDRDLTVLNALLTFYPGNSLTTGPGLIVFPSNAALSERAHGMAESTLRRHLAALIEAGVILRHDSPNGKRYAARGRNGAVVRAFGFDLKPLLVRAVEIAEAAEMVRISAERLRRRREEAVLILRDVSKLVDYAIEDGHSGDWDTLGFRVAVARRATRRKLTLAELDVLCDDLDALLTEVRATFIDEDSEIMDGNDVCFERHYQNSKPDSYESEPCLEQERGEGLDAVSDAPPDKAKEPGIDPEPRLPLAVVLKACPDLKDYAQEDIRHWHQLVTAASFVRGMMGVSPDAWVQACQAMGHENASIVLVCMLQRINQINSPGGYLRSLTAKAEDGAFSPGPMVMALLNTTNKVAA